MTAEATQGSLESLRIDAPAHRPIALVNLLRFAETALVDGETMTGDAAYAEYVSRIEPALVREGGRPVFRSRGSTVLVGDPEETWDEVVVVWYPSRSAFERFAESEEYQSNAAHRVAALADARLIAVRSPQRIGRLAASLYALSVKLRR